MARMKLYALNKDKKMSVLDKIETKVVLFSLNLMWFFGANASFDPETHHPLPSNSSAAWSQKQASSKVPYLVFCLYFAL